MIKIVKYRCEICHRNHDDPDSAIKCESRGVPKPIPHLVGLMYRYRQDNLVTLAIPPEYGDDRIADLIDGHCLNESLVATRNNCNGDSVGDSRCGGGHYINIEYIKSLRHDDAFIKQSNTIRMIDFLRSIGIKPKYTNLDGEIVEL